MSKTRRVKRRARAARKAEFDVKKGHREFFYVLGWLGIFNPLWWLTLVAAFAVGRRNFFNRKVIYYWGFPNLLVAAVIIIYLFA